MTKTTITFYFCVQEPGNFVGEIHSGCALVINKVAGFFNGKNNI